MGSFSLTAASNDIGCKLPVCPQRLSISLMTCKAFIFPLHLLEASKIALVSLPVFLPSELSSGNSLGEFNDSCRRNKARGPDEHGYISAYSVNINRF